METPAQHLLVTRQIKPKMCPQSSVRHGIMDQEWLSYPISMCPESNPAHKKVIQLQTTATRQVKLKIYKGKTNFWFQNLSQSTQYMT